MREGRPRLQCATREHACDVVSVCGLPVGTTIDERLLRLVTGPMHDATSGAGKHMLYIKEEQVHRQQRCHNLHVCNKLSNNCHMSPCQQNVPVIESSVAVCLRPPSPAHLKLCLQEPAQNPA